MKLFELTVRILCDQRLELIADGIFLCSQTEDNQDSVFGIARQMLNKGLASRVLVSDTKAISGYPGFNSWEKHLNKSGIPSEHIKGIGIDKTPTLNTLIEARALIRYAKSKQYRSIYVAAAAFHQVRAFMTAVTVALIEYPELIIISSPGTYLPWDETVIHSQGNTKGTRSSLLTDEFNRIEQYQRKGDLASVSDVLNYLNRRDASLSHRATP